jgi:polar amino acid transport system substrate-binding protein
MQINQGKRMMTKWLGGCLLIGTIVLGLVSISCSSSYTSSSSLNDQSTSITRISVATDFNWPPFEFVNEQSGQLEGFDIDLINAIAKKENLEVQLIEVEFDPLLAGMAQGKYDAAISCITINAERKKDMLFSEPYFAAGQIITIRQDNGTLINKDTLAGKVGALKGSTGAAETVKVKNATLITYSDIDQAFQDLINGQNDAVVCDNPVALVYVGRYPDKLRTTGGVFTDENYGIAINKDKPDLQAKMNTGLKAVMNEGLIEQLTDKWLKSNP